MVRVTYWHWLGDHRDLLLRDGRVGLHRDRWVDRVPLLLLLGWVPLLLGWVPLLLLG